MNAEQRFPPLLNLSRREAIVIGASAGAVDALATLLPALPEKLSAPVFIVVHVPPDRNSILPELFGAKCRLPVREAEDKECIEPGTVYFAPPDYHLQVELDKTLSLSSDEPILFSRPSVDVLFQTAADSYGDKLIGVVLTGANADGAAGLRAVISGGGLGLVLNPELAYASAMPAAALAACPEAAVMTLEEIASCLRQMS